jgi:FKBP-type peptidyl-prolyl cis-trans isomerase
MAINAFFGNVMKCKLIAAVILIGAVAGYTFFQKEPNQPTPSKEEKKKENKKMELIIEDTLVGEGDVAAKKDTLKMHYTGKLENGKVFDSSHNRGEPLKFKLGVGQVIEGWDEGIAGMKVGGKRTLTIPPHMAYGERGAGASIPPNSTLIFDIELVEVIK